jgi:16S rRNA processing protein RimM
MAIKEQVFVNIGHTKRAHGLTGEIKVSIEDQYLEDFLKNERIFIAVKSSKIPYFIANVRGKGELIVQLEDVVGRDAAQVLQSKEIFLREQDILHEEERELEVLDDSLEYEVLTGFFILDKTLGEIGVINEVLEMPQQEMAFMVYKGREVLIPLNKQLIVEVDEEKRIVHMDLPEGLLDV